MSSVENKRIVRNIGLILACVFILLAGSLVLTDEANADTAGDNCLTFSSPSSFTLNADKGWNGTMYYSTDKTTWNVWNGGTTLTSALGSGSKYYLYFRGIGNTYISGMGANTWTITGDSVSCTGNVETLLDYTVVAAGNHPNMDNRCYESMFLDCSALIEAPTLGAESLVPYCYVSMFRGCTNLKKVPDKLGNELAYSCCFQMFADCSSLVDAPELPATVLAVECYCGMFANCSSLVNAPQLPAMVLADSCYFNMFANCRSLTEAPNLPADCMCNDCYRNMFYCCTSLEEVPFMQMPTNLATNCYYGMFRLTKVVAKTTSSEGYRRAFMLPVSTTGMSCTQQMFLTADSEIATPELGVTYYLKSEKFDVTFDSSLDAKVFGSNISNGKCDSYVPITFSADAGYIIRDLYYVENDDITATHHLIANSGGVYSLVMPKKNITVGGTIAVPIVTINGEYFFEDNIQSGIQTAVSNGYVVKLLSDLGTSANTSSVSINGGNLYIDFNGHSWGNVVTLGMSGVVGINVAGENSGMSSTIDNIRNSLNINHSVAAGTKQAANIWLDLDGDGYINESDVSFVREKFET